MQNAGRVRFCSPYALKFLRTHVPSRKTSEPPPRSRPRQSTRPPSPHASALSLMCLGVVNVSSSESSRTRWMLHQLLLGEDARRLMPAALRQLRSSAAALSCACGGRRHALRASHGRLGGHGGLGGRRMITDLITHSFLLWQQAKGRFKGRTFSVRTAPAYIAAKTGCGCEDDERFFRKQSSI